jgi:hypothetical protein
LSNLAEKLIIEVGIGFYSHSREMVLKWVLINLAWHLTHELLTVEVVLVLCHFALWSALVVQKRRVVDKALECVLKLSEEWVLLEHLRGSSFV